MILSELRWRERFCGFPQHARVEGHRDQTVLPEGKLCMICLNTCAIADIACMFGNTQQITVRN